MTSEITVIIIAAGMLFLLIQGRIQERRDNAKKIERIRQQWGKAPEREYDYEEFESISHYFKHHQREGWLIDDITWNDLEMDRLFSVMNTTYSSIGQEYLYRMLREPVFDEAVLKERNRLADYFLKNKEKREQIQLAFHKAGRTRRLALTDYVYHFADLKMSEQAKHLFHMGLILVSILLMAFAPKVGAPVFVAAIVFNLVQYYRSKAKVENYFQCIYYICALLKCADEITQIKEPQLEEYMKELRGINKSMGRIRVTVRLIRSGQSAGGSLGDIIMDYIRMLFHVDLIAFYAILKDVKGNLDKIDRLLEVLGQLECGIAIASFRKALPYYSCPVLVKQAEPVYHGADLYHPLIEEPVTNSIAAEGGVLITGSNASGKSTFLKTAAINAVLAQSVYTVTASAYRANYFKILSSMALQDNLEGNESYYIVEIKSLKRILDEVKKEEPVLCFIDEVLRGTNTVERIAASAQILESLSRKQVLCFAATHDIELTYLLEHVYSNYHFREEVTDNDISFSYALHHGRAMTRNAIRLLSIIGYDEEIIKAAEATAESFMKTGKWQMPAR